MELISAGMQARQTEQNKRAMRPRKQAWHFFWQRLKLADLGNQTARPHSVGILTVIFVTLTSLVSGQAAVIAIDIYKTNYHGWPDAIVMRNHQIEAVIVPALNRVIQLKFCGGEDLLWENRDLDGRVPDGKAEEWMNFGGDKAWPAPQKDWGKFTGKAAFFPRRDSMVCRPRPGSNLGSLSYSLQSIPSTAYRLFAQSRWSLSDRCSELRRSLCSPGRNP
jgi:hypothetical protein